MLDTSTLKLAADASDTPIDNGSVWRSLQVNPYALFEKGSLHKLLNVYTRRALPNVDSRLVINLRLETMGAHGCIVPPSPGRLIALAEPQLMMGDEVPVDSIVLISLCIVVDQRALNARQLRTRETPLGAAMQQGFVPTTKALAKNDQYEIRRPVPPITPQEMRRFEQTYSLFRDHLDGGESVYERLQSGAPMELAMLTQELRTRAQRAAQMARHAAPVDDEPLLRGRRARPANDDDDEDFEPEARNEAPVARAQPSVDEITSEQDAQEIARVNIKPLDVYRSNELAWLRLLVQNNLYKLQASAPRVYVTSKLLERARRLVCNGSTDCPLLRTVFASRDEDHCVFYILNQEALDAPDSPREEMPRPVPQAPESEDDEPDILTQTWRDVFIKLANDLSLYELETYARARLRALIVLLHAANANTSVDRLQSLRHPALKNYPKQSGADRHILTLLGDGALAHEGEHEAIGRGTLALAAMRHERLRDSLLMLELLLHQHTASGMVAEPNDDDEEQPQDPEKHMREICAPFEQFWKSAGDLFTNPGDLALLAHVLSGLTDDWMRELDAMGEE